MQVSVLLDSASASVLYPKPDARLTLNYPSLIVARRPSLLSYPAIDSVWCTHSLESRRESADTWPCSAISSRNCFRWSGTSTYSIFPTTTRISFDKPSCGVLRASRAELIRIPPIEETLEHSRGFWGWTSGRIGAVRNPGNMAWSSAFKTSCPLTPSFFPRRS